MRAILFVNGHEVSGDIVEISLSKTRDEMYGGLGRVKTTASVEVAIHE